MEKRRVIERIIEYLSEEAREAQERGEADRARELERLLVIYRFLPTREYGPDDVVIPSALVALELGSTVAHYFIAPQGGGLVTEIEGQPVQVITPYSPLGEVLLGKKKGDRVEVSIRGGTRSYRIVELS